MTRTIRTVAQFCDENPAFSQNSVRWLIFNARANGLGEAGAIVRLGRRVYVDVDAFFGWLESQQRDSRATA